jgi:hypothetical protein
MTSFLFVSWDFLFWSCFKRKTRGTTAFNLCTLGFVFFLLVGWRKRWLAVRARQFVKHFETRTKVVNEAPASPVSERNKQTKEAKRGRAAYL